MTLLKAESEKSEISKVNQLTSFHFIIVVRFTFKYEIVIFSGCKSANCIALKISTNVGMHA